MKRVTDDVEENGQGQADQLGAIGDRIKCFGAEVVVVVPDSTLVEVGEEVLIATTGDCDRKDLGRLCFRVALKYLLGPQQNPSLIKIN